MSSEDLKKQHIRTQGKYSDTDLMKNRDKKHKVSPKEINEKKVPKRYSTERRKSDEHPSVKYEENSRVSFGELEEQKKPIEISAPGKHPISSTERGESLIYYKPDFFGKDEAWDLFRRLNDATAWNTKNIVIRGEEYPQPRLVAWYGPYPYSYSGTTLEAAEMPDIVISIKEKIEAYLKDQGVKAEFNSVLLNLYRNEKDSVAWHSDDELTMGICPTIASISLGEVRRFEIRRKRRYDEENQQEYQQMFMNLCHGSLVVMDGCMQEDWQHRIPKEYHDKASRINLTFRTVFPIDKSPCLPGMEHPKKYAAPSNSTKTTNSGRAIEFNDTDFPPLNSNVKTNGKLSDPSEFWDSDNNNDDKNVEAIVSEDKKPEDGSIDATALMLPDDTTENDPGRPRPRSPRRTPPLRPDRPPNRRSNEIFRREPNDSKPHFRKSDNNRNNRYSTNQNHVRRGSNRNYNDRTSRQLDKEVEGRQDEDRSWGKEDFGERRHKRDENDEKSYRRDENEERSWRKDFRERRDKRDENEVKTYRRDENEERSWKKEDFGERRHKRDENEERNYQRDENQGKSYRRDENEERNYRRDENEERNYRRDENEERNYRRDENVRRRDQRDVITRLQRRQNNNTRRGNFSNLQNDDERQERNSQSRDYGDRCHERVPQRHNGDRQWFNNLPPRYSNNKRNMQRYKVEDETLSGESFDNDKHANELVKKEHHGLDHNKEHSNNTWNLAASEFVPKFHSPAHNFDQMSLENLLLQDIRQMNDNNIQNYAKNLKSRVLEILDEFEPNEKEDLEFLCAITDGSQNTKNQQLISVRTANIAVDYVDRKSASKDS